MQFYHKEYDEIRLMPVSRFFGYIEYMNNYYNAQNTTPRDSSISKAKELDWGDEIKGKK